MTQGSSNQEKPSRKYFGTDGIRGQANRFPMDCETVMRAGRAIAEELGGGSKRSKIVVVQDTRLSGDMLVHAVSAGICLAGGHPRLAGVLPTPAAAVLAARSDACGAVVVSASHNPYGDNGIKVFGADGYKLSTEREAAVERRMASPAQPPTKGEGTVEVGRWENLPDAADIYTEFLMSGMPDGFHLDGTKMVVDCANGAAFQVAPALFSRLGADVTVLFADPDGRNINENCGSEHPGRLAETVRNTGAQIGIALDGDADRLVVVDETGQVRTGDQIIAIMADFMHRSGRLQNSKVVTTVMSNMGLGEALRTLGVAHDTTAVGDRNVMARMRETGAVLGGEDSGHLIFMDHHTTGDGLYAALRLLEALRSKRPSPLSQRCAVMRVFPQALLAVPVREKPLLESRPKIRQAMEKAEAELGDTGRVLVRYSGTQPVCRVMVEGADSEQVPALCRRIADSVAAEIG